MRSIVGLDQLKCVIDRIQVGKVIVPDNDIIRLADVVLQSVAGAGFIYRKFIR